MSCGVGRRLGSDLALLWLWRRPGATAPIRTLAWEPPCASGMAPEKTKKKILSKEKYRNSFRFVKSLGFHTSNQEITKSLHGYF